MVATTSQLPIALLDPKFPDSAKTNPVVSEKLSYSPTHEHSGVVTSCPFSLFAFPSREGKEKEKKGKIRQLLGAHALTVHINLLIFEQQALQ